MPKRNRDEKQSPRKRVKVTNLDSPKFIREILSDIFKRRGIHIRLLTKWVNSVSKLHHESVKEINMKPLLSYIKSDKLFETDDEPSQQLEPDEYEELGLSESESRDLKEMKDKWLEAFNDVSFSDWSKYGYLIGNSIHQLYDRKVEEQKTSTEVSSDKWISMKELGGPDIPIDINIGKIRDIEKKGTVNLANLTAYLSEVPKATGQVILKGTFRIMGIVLPISILHLVKLCKRIPGFQSIWDLLNYLHESRLTTVFESIIHPTFNISKPEKDDVERARGIDDKYHKLLLLVYIDTILKLATIPIKLVSAKQSSSLIELDGHGNKDMKILSQLSVSQILAQGIDQLTRYLNKGKMSIDERGVCWEIIYPREILLSYYIIRADKSVGKPMILDTPSVIITSESEPEYEPRDVRMSDGAKKKKKKRKNTIRKRKRKKSKKKSK